MILDSFSVELKFQIPIVRGIMDLLGWISDSKAQDSGFQKQIFDSPGFRITFKWCLTGPD